MLGSNQAVSQRILVVDDEFSILQLIRNKLELSGFETITASSGYEALNMIEQYGLPHLAVVDISMPGMNGFQLCQTIQQFADVPIILLTANSEEDTIVLGIEKYAEDYMTKPFSLRELVARIKRVLNRIGDFAYTLEPVISVDERLSINFVNRSMMIDQQTITLTPIETKLLYILMRNAGQIVTTDILLQRLWPLEEVFADALRVHVYRLRHKVEINPSKPKYIITERGKGYLFPLLTK